MGSSSALQRLWALTFASALTLAAACDGAESKAVDVTPTFAPMAAAEPTRQPTAVPPAPTPQPSPEPIIETPPDRTSCSAIAGSDYRSDAERQWFIDNCKPPTPRATSSSPGSAASEPPIMRAAPPNAAAPICTAPDVTVSTNYTTG